MWLKKIPNIEKKIISVINHVKKERQKKRKETEFQARNEVATAKAHIKLTVGFEFFCVPCANIFGVVLAVISTIKCFYPIVDIF
jgi:hypothetical protein